MSASRRQARARRGWSLVEVVFSVALLGGTLLGFGEFGRRFGHVNGTSTVLSQAVDLAAARVERVKFERTYATIDTCATAVQSVPGSSFSIRTQIARTNTVQTDYKTITVTVTHARLAAAVVKTTAIAAF
jgi:Tfp pilus assembly protein PilV